MFSYLFFLGWVALMAVVLVASISGFRRTRAWYMLCLAAGAALHLYSLVLFGPWGDPAYAIARLLGRYIGPSPAWWVGEELSMIGKGALLLGPLLLVIGGIACYLAYTWEALPKLDRRPPEADEDKDDAG